MSKNNWEIGISCNPYKERMKPVFEHCQKAGVGAIEISFLYNMCGFDCAKNIFDTADFSELKNLSEGTGVKLWSYHLPFDHGEVNIASLDKKVREQTIALDSAMIEKSAECGIGMIVIHPSGEPIDDKDRADSMECAKEGILKLNETAKKCGVTLAVENLPRTCLGNVGMEIMDIVKQDDSMAVCFDVNHLLMQSHKDFVEEVGYRIKTVHISDYDFINERHFAPGQGKIDWKELFELLHKINYKGPFMNEVKDIVFDWEKTPDNLTYSELKKINDELLAKY